MAIVATMKHVSIKDAKDRFAELVRDAEAGERVVVTRRGKAVAELVPLRGGIDMEGLRRWKREHGLPRHIVGPMSPDFDDPLPEDFLITPGPY